MIIYDFKSNKKGCSSELLTRWRLSSLDHADRQMLITLGNFNT